jgi:hypothetical protein
MWQAGLAKPRMRECQVILKRELAHHSAGGFNPAEFSAALIWIADRARGPTESIGPEEHELVMDFGHCSLVRQFDRASAALSFSAIA